MREHRHGASSTPPFARPAWGRGTALLGSPAVHKGLQLHGSPSNLQLLKVAAQLIATFNPRLQKVAEG